jgi:hypothetical protein
MITGIIFILIGALLLYNVWGTKEEDGFCTRRLKALSTIIGFKATRMMILMMGAIFMLIGLSSFFTPKH